MFVVLKKSTQTDFQQIRMNEEQTTAICPISFEIWDWFSKAELRL